MIPSVFGVPLEVLIARENPGVMDLEGIVPRVLDVCLTEIERRGLNETGLCMLTQRSLPAE